MQRKQHVQSACDGGNEAYLKNGKEVNVPGAQARESLL